MRGVAIFSDASGSHHHQSAGYGFWAKGDERHSICGGGSFREYSKPPHIIELLGIANALSICDRHGYFRDEDKRATIQCDSLHALRIIKSTVPGAVALRVNKKQQIQNIKFKGRKEEKDAVELIQMIQAKHGLEIQLKHVKGHTSGGDGRHFVNRLCDRLAKEGRLAFENGYRPLFFWANSDLHFARLSRLKAEQEFKAHG